MKKVSKFSNLKKYFKLVIRKLWKCVNFTTLRKTNFQMSENSLVRIQAHLSSFDQSFRWPTWATARWIVLLSWTDKEIKGIKIPFISIWEQKIQSLCITSILSLNIISVAKWHLDTWRVSEWFKFYCMEVITVTFQSLNNSNLHLVLVTFDLGLLN